MTRHCFVGLAVALTVLAVGACSDGGSGPSTEGLEMVVAGGNGQFGTPGQTLAEPLHVVVRDATSGKAKNDVGVRWSVVSGDASLVTAAATLTDETGSAFATVRMGTDPGPVGVRAELTDDPSISVLFELTLVERPELTSVAPTQAAPGASVVLTGANFSPLPEQNVVLFSGVRGEVTAAAATELSVRVPACLAQGQVDVRVQLGTVGSETRALTVTDDGDLTPVAVGETLDVADPQGYTCVRIPSGDYVAVVYSAGTVAGAQVPYTLVSLAYGPPAAKVGARREPPGAVAVSQGSRQGREGAAHPQLLWDEELRRAENRAISDIRPAGQPAPPRMPGPARAVPQKGERRTFKVFNRDREFEDVTAVAEYVGSHAAIFVEESESGAFSAADLEAFSHRFDDVIHPTVTGAFGQESDLDDNQRVIILFTSVVNRLTPRGASGFVGGFFFGVDLLPEREGSNRGEIFYALVPDPSGTHSDPRPKSKVLNVVPAILAHEFQHMVHFNERVLKLEAEVNEALWLSEGLAQMAEELVARAYEAEGDEDDAELFRSGNRTRALRYLADPGAVSLIVTAGQGTLEERGAGWLHVLYLASRYGDGILRDLVRSTRTGVANVEHRTAEAWPPLLADWWAATALDGRGFPAPLEYPGVDLGALLGNQGAAVVATLGSADSTVARNLQSSSAEYYVVRPTQGGSTTLRLGGAAGGASLPQSELRWRLVRVF